MNFHYKAYDKNNKLVEADLQAADQTQAQVFLTQQGLEVLSLQEVIVKPVVRSAGGWNFGLVSLDQKMLFTKHLSLMLKSGMPVNEAIATLVKDNKGHFRWVLRKILSSIEGGNHLTDSLALFPQVFDGFYLNMVKIGEESGTLERSLVNLADHLKKTHDLRNKIQAALLYPIIILTAMTGLGFSLSIFVLPKLAGLFSSLGSELPWSTRALITTSQFISNHWQSIIAWFVCALIAIFILRRLRPVKRIFHAIALHSPIVAKFSRTMNVASFSRSVGLLLTSGITLDKALEIVGGNIYNVYYQDDINFFLEQVKRGESMGEVMKSRTSRFPLIVSHMIKVGEQSGNLAETFDYLANFYEDDLDNISKNLSGVLEPILLIVMGAAVGFIAFSVITPIYDFTTSVG
ncbi:MAG: type II secretion system F family protein [Candidatus Komeilibacteria bacterium]